MRLIARQFVPLVLLTLLLPALAGYIATGTLAGAATGLLWGGLVRVFFVHQVTWSVNSVCHYFGTRRFSTDWHHNHHAFPRSAVHGLQRWEVDPSALIIAALERVGLAWNVVRISPERQAQRTA
jgi:stearoyl-CoA desaturase (delta-9 desaturase)